MKIGLVLAVCGAAVVTVGLTGCSNDKGTQSGNSTAGSASANGQYSGTTTIVVADKPLVTGAPTLCSPLPDSGLVINIGQNTADGRGVVLKGDPPSVEGVELANVNGQYVSYVASTPQEGWGATVTKDGKHYSVKGTFKNDHGEVTSYQVDATCS